MWRTVKLGDYLTVQNGFAFDSKLFSANGEVGLIRIRDLKEGVSTETRYTGQYDKKFIVQRGDLLIGMDGEFRCYEWKGEDALLNQRVCRLQDFDTELDKRFLLYVINDELKKIEDVTGFTTVKHLSSKTIKEIQLHLPPLAEQKRIVAKLDAAFAEIDRAIEITKAKEAEVVKLLSETIDKIVNEVDFVSTEMALGEVAKFLDYRGRTPSKTETGIKLLTAKNVRMGFIKQDPEEFVSSETYHAHMTRGFPKVGDVVFTTEAPLGLVAQIESADIALGQRLITFQVKNNLVKNEFLKYLLMSRTYQNKIQDAGTGATVKGIKASLLKKIAISFPNSIDEQAQRVRIVEKIEAHISTVQSSIFEKIENLSSLKSAILAQELQQPQSEAA